MTKLPHLAFLVFLGVYSLFKYRAVPDLMGQPAYVKTTAILVVLTAILPYIIVWFATKNMTGGRRIGIAIIMALLLSAIGLATYFYLFIAPNAPGMSVMQVLPRAVVPGLIIGAILALPALIRAKQ